MTDSKRMSNRLAFAAIALAISSLTSVARAVTLYSSGAKTWDTSTANWGSVSGGPYNTSTWNNATPDSAIFQGTAGTVALGTNINIENLTFNLPSAAGAGYFIGGVAEINSLNFSGTKTLTLTATGTGTNQDVAIRAGITGSPTMNIAGRATNAVDTFSLLPTVGVTQTIGTLNMQNTNASNKRLILGGASTGNVVDRITWTVTANQLMIGKEGTGTWTINQNLNIDDGRLYVENGTLIVSGTDNFFSHKIGVNTVTESNFTNSGGSAKLVAQGDWTINDTREDFVIQGGGTIAPGSSVGTLSVDWNNVGGSTGEFIMQNGSIYEWEVGAGNLTDVIHVETGAASTANLVIGNMILKILDAGGTPLATDQLPVFTYETGAQTVVRSIGTVTFDTSMLGPGWGFDNLQLIDNNNGTIYLTGLSFTDAAVPEPASIALWSLLGLGLVSVGAWRARRKVN